MQVLEFLKGLLFLLPEIAILVGVIYYAAKVKTTDGVLMLVGSIIGMLVAIFWRIIIPIITYLDGYSYLSGTMGIYTILGVIGFIGSVFFAIGLILLVTKVASQRKESDSPFNQKF